MFLDAVAVLTAFTALVNDLKNYRISNKTIAAGFAAACLARFYCDGASALPDMAAGMLFPLIICMPLLLFYMIGAGDIKLFMVIGLCLGCPLIIQLMILTCISAAAAVCIKRLSGNVLIERFKYLAAYMNAVFSGGRILPYIDEDEKRNNAIFLIHMSAPVFISLIILICIKRIK